MILSSAAALVSTGMRDSGYNHIMIGGVGGLRRDT